MCEKYPVGKEKWSQFLRKNRLKNAKNHGFIEMKRRNVVHNAQLKKRWPCILVQNAEKVHTAQINVAGLHTNMGNTYKQRAKKMDV